VVGSKNGGSDMNKTDELKINGFSELSKNELQETEGGSVTFTVCCVVMACVAIAKAY
jgi:lactobin A/cerein 7B family class IIb bacteriocin